MIDAVRQRGHRRLEVQHQVQRDGDDGRSERREDVPELADTGGVRPAAPADVDGGPDLQDVTAVEGGRRG